MLIVQKNDKGECNGMIRYIQKILDERRLKKEQQLQLRELNVVEMQNFHKWYEMLYKKKKMVIIGSNSQEEFAQKYEDFFDSLDMGSGRLGAIWSIEEKKFSVVNGEYHFMVEYRQFELKNDVTYEEYKAAIEEYDSTRKMIQESKNAFKNQ